MASPTVSDSDPGGSSQQGGASASPPTPPSSLPSPTEEGAPPPEPILPDVPSEVNDAPHEEISLDDPAVDEPAPKPTRVEPALTEPAPTNSASAEPAPLPTREELGLPVDATDALIRVIVGLPAHWREPYVEGYCEADAAWRKRMNDQAEEREAKQAELTALGVSMDDPEPPTPRRATVRRPLVRSCSQNSSTDSDYISRKIREQIKGSSATIVLIGRDTAQSAWVEKEIAWSKGAGHGILGIRIDPDAEVPAGLTEYGAEIINWYDPSDVAAFDGAVERAIAATSRAARMPTNSASTCTR